jgi:hypothetical protein
MWRQLWTNLRHCSGICLEECRKTGKASQNCKLWLIFELNISWIDVRCITAWAGYLLVLVKHRSRWVWEKKVGNCLFFMLFSSRADILLVLIMRTCTAGCTLNCRSSVDQLHHHKLPLIPMGLNKSCSKDMKELDGICISKLGNSKGTTQLLMEL